MPQDLKICLAIQPLLINLKLAVNKLRNWNMSSINMLLLSHPPNVISQSLTNMHLEGFGKGLCKLLWPT